MDMKLLVVCLLFMAVGAGCVFVDPAPGVQGVEVEFQGNVTVNGSMFLMDGVVTSTGNIESEGVFENVSVTLYRENGRPLCTRDMGPLQKDGGRRNVTLRWSATPRYVIIDSADIWQSKHGRAEFYKITDGGIETSETANSRGKLPVDATNRSETACNE